ncbi:MAG: polyhydroxyalkanoate synthesis repressor PhaR [Hyphomicrobiales bacterium]|nr:MAG: polyhydroxyalkanoate synthesis repressor PhaR [Hyphomicrobiales bacterium]
MLNKSTTATDKKEPVVIKKYANRRLYNTETSTYVTLDDLAAMVKNERDFVVFDAKSGDDLTHSVLTQIIVDQEGRMGNQTLLSVPFLQQLIRFYGAGIQKLVPSYLQISLESLAREQERFRGQFAGAFTPHGAFELYQEQARKNLAMFEQAMNMFSPLGKAAGAEGEGGEAAAAATPAVEQASGSTSSEEIAELKSQLATMQARLEKLSSKD